MNDWALVYDSYEPGQEGVREALCTLGNGHFATRGAAPESVADNVHYPGTYVAGLYNRLTTEFGGKAIENEDLVNAPNWLPITFRINGGAWFDLKDVNLLAYRQELDMRRGALTRLVRFDDTCGRRTLITQRRFVHQYQPNMAGLETTILPENWSGRLEIQSAIDGCIENTGVDRYKALARHHHDPIEATEIDANTIFLEVETVQSHVRVAIAARTRVYLDGDLVQRPSELTVEKAWIAHNIALDACRGSSVRIDKVIALVTSTNNAISEPGDQARKLVSRAEDFQHLFDSHVLAWHHLWQRFDIRVTDGSKRTASILRLHIFGLLQTVSVNSIDLDVGVPARGWHGEAYRGHIFWDELFIFSFLNLRLPELTRALLHYRYRRLPEARWRAKQASYAGAMFPWQSGSDGREESQRLHLNPISGGWTPDVSHLQRHVNAAIAYNVWHYYEVTGDIEFLTLYGVEMLVEIARFWASIATYNEETDRYEILGVMGPDEYHDRYPGAELPGLNNNAYTNVMAVWVLLRTLDALELLPERLGPALWSKLDLHPKELDHWRDITTKMQICFVGQGVIAQFEGYEQLKEFNWAGYHERYGDITRLDRILDAEGDSTNNYRLSKQADVLMLFYLFSAEELEDIFTRLGYAFDCGSAIQKNIEYYVFRTSHGSTLSSVVHSWVLARSDRARSWQFFTQALQSDISDIQGGTTAEGIHLGAMAGTVDLVQRGYTGLVVRENMLWFDPQLPDELVGISFDICYRHSWLTIEVTNDLLRIKVSDGAAKSIRVAVRQGPDFEIFVIAPGEVLELSI